MSGIRVVRYDTLEPQWHVPGAREPGFMRWLISWVGGPAGYVNPNKEATVISEECVVGMMRLFEGQQQKGLHYHSVTEIYIILKGELMSYDGRGEITSAGPMDCIYIPAGVPHGVKNAGVGDCDLVWVHDGIEKIGTSIYYMDGIVTGPPQVDDISMVRWNDLRPNEEAPLCARQGFLRWLISWVGGSGDKQINYNRAVAVVSNKIGLGMTCLKAGQSTPRQISSVGNCFLLVKGAASCESGTGDETQQLTRLDTFWVPKNTAYKLYNTSEDDSWILWVQDLVQDIAGIQLLES